MVRPGYWHHAFSIACGTGSSEPVRFAEHRSVADHTANDVHGDGGRHDATGGRHDSDRRDCRARADIERRGDIDNSGALDLSSYLNRRLNGVHVNEVQNNPLPAGRELSGLHRFAPSRHTAGAVGLHGRRATESALRRSGQLGSDSSHGDLLRRAHARVESAVRSQHARRRPVDPDQGRSQRTRHEGPGDVRQRRAPFARVRTWRQPFQ